MQGKPRLGRFRAVPVLGLTQILAWGALYYPPVLTMPRLAAERGWSTAFAMAGFSLSLLVAGLAAPTVGRLIDRHGGHRVLPLGALLGACGLAALTQAQTPPAYFATWMLLGVAIAASLYDAAFASLGRIFGTGARGPITAVTLMGGFASTVSWPVTRALLDAVGWRATYLLYAALLAAVSAPLYAWALPREWAPADVFPAGAAAPALPASPPRRLPGDVTLALLMAAFSAYAFVPSGLVANLLAMLERLGLDRGTAVAIGMLFGPCQVVARVGEFAFARNVHPLLVVRAALSALALGFGAVALLGFSAPVAAAFMILLGLCNGLVTIARGTLPLALFGASRYGALVGRIAGPAFAVQAAAPFAVALLSDRLSDAAALAAVGVIAFASLGLFFLLRRPEPAAFTRRQP